MDDSVKFRQYVRDQSQSSIIVHNATKRNLPEPLTVVYRCRKGHQDWKPWRSLPEGQARRLASRRDRFYDFRVRED